MEIPNKQVLDELVAGVTPTDDHGDLLAALRERYPALTWRVAPYEEEWYREDQQVLQDGQVVAPDLKAWLQERLDAAGGDFRAAWQQVKGQGYGRFDEVGTTVFAAAVVGPRPEDVIQLKIDHVYDIRPIGIADSWAPNDVDDFLRPCSRESVPWTLPARPRYGLKRVNNIARTLALSEQLEAEHRLGVVANHKVLVTEVLLDSPDPSPAPIEKSVLDVDPDYLHRAIRERRFVADWAASSAAIAPITEHWAFDVHDYVWNDRRNVGFTPRPLTWGDEIGYDGDRTIYQLMDALERFDAQVGHTFAWFFHAVYGNRLGSWAIEQVAEGLKRGKVGLPEADAAAVKRWVASTYGF